MTSVLRDVWFGVSLCLLVGAARAQSPDLTTTNYISHRFKSAVYASAHEVVDVPPNGTSNDCILTWRIFAKDADHADVSLPLPFQRTGAIAPISNNRTFVVSGARVNGDAVLCRVRIVDTPTRQVVLDETKLYQGFYPYGLAFADQTLFVLDRNPNGNRILAAAWPGTGTLPIGSAFAPIMDTSTWPDLQNVGTFGLFPAAPTYASGILLAKKGPETTRMRGRPTRIYFDNVWKATFKPWKDVVPLPWPFSVRNFGFISSKGVLIVQGPAGAFEVRNNMTGQVVASGTVTTAYEEEVHVAIVGELVPGHPHQVTTNPGSNNSRVFHPSVRYGSSVDLGGLLADKGVVDASRCKVNSPGFAPAFGLHRHPAPTALEYTPTSLLVAFRDGNGNDPIVDAGGGVFYLNAAVRYDYTTVLGPDLTGATNGYPLPIPDDPGLEGLVILFQFAALAPDNSLVVSDIFGSTILSSGGAAAAAAHGPRIWSALNSKDKANAMAAASRWLLKLGGKKTTLSSRKSEIVALLTQILLANKQRTVKSK